MGLFNTFTILKIAVLLGVLKLYVETEKPLLCAGLYAAFAGFVRLLLGATPFQFLFGVACVFVLSAIYFGLLSKFDTATTLWWLILIAGFVIGLV